MSLFLSFPLVSEEGEGSGLERWNVRHYTAYTEKEMLLNDIIGTEPH